MSEIKRGFREVKSYRVERNGVELGIYRKLPLVEAEIGVKSIVMRNWFGRPSNKLLPFWHKGYCVSRVRLVDGFKWVDESGNPVKVLEKPANVGNIPVGKRYVKPKVVKEDLGSGVVLLKQEEVKDEKKVIDRGDDVQLIMDN